MSTEVWATLGVGAAMTGLLWRMFGTIERQIQGTDTKLTGLVSGLARDVADLGVRMAKLEDAVDGLLRGQRRSRGRTG